MVWAVDVEPPLLDAAKAASSLWQELEGVVGTEEVAADVAGVVEVVVDVGLDEVVVDAGSDEVVVDVGVGQVVVDVGVEVVEPCVAQAGSTESSASMAAQRLVAARDAPTVAM
jgi:hypothetical protein